MHHHICRSTASRSPVLTCAGICVQPTVTYLPCRVSGSTITAVGRSQLLARWPGTHCRILSRIQRAAQTVLGVYLKHTCSRDTSASSAKGVPTDNALYKSKSKSKSSASLGWNKGGNVTSAGWQVTLCDPVWYERVPVAVWQCYTATELINS